MNASFQHLVHNEIPCILFYVKVFTQKVKEAGGKRVMGKFGLLFYC